MSFRFTANNGNHERGKNNFNFTPVFPTSDYTKEIQELKNEIIGMKNSISEVLEMKKCMNEISELKKNIDEVLEMKKCMNEISEIKKNIDEVLEIKHSINDLKSLLTNFLNPKDGNKDNSNNSLSQSKQQTDNDKLNINNINNNENNIDSTNNNKTLLQNLDNSGNVNNNDISNDDSQNEKCNNDNLNLKNSSNKGNTDIPEFSSEENSETNLSNDTIENKTDSNTDNHETINEIENQVNNEEIKRPIEAIGEQEPIYDQRIKYIAKALKIDFFTNIDKKITVGCSVETKEKIKESLKKIFEIREYLFYLETEKKDLINVIEMAYKTNFNNFSSIRTLTERLDMLSIKINQIYKKCDIIKQSSDNEIYLKYDDINDNDIKNVEVCYSLDARKKRQLSTFNIFIKEFMPYSSDKFYMEYQFQISFILTQLNRIRLMFVCPSASLLFKKDNCFKNITTFSINIPSQNTTESLLLGKYKDNIYKYEYYLNKFSFYLNKNSFYNDSYNVITLH
ncbi:hypothetical protein PIROE2DRAFT_2685 [Piromyces sp. E2]|nr:hypothetical protein PIROE2DRAFT_2685 [Piromyces sp. E2]|eukprot:OUM69384.1 hypothetical protein PIROE2DRAFT_2685 [Piromyces sp. E2]